METNTRPTTQVKSSQVQNDWDKREIGALWKRDGKNQKYLSGHIKFSDEFGSERKMDVMIFANKSKKNDNHPDFRIYFNDRAKPATPAASTTASAPVKPKQVAPKPQPQEVTEEEELI